MVNYSQRASYLRSHFGSQARAAKELGVSRSTFQDIEKGATQKPSQRVRDSLNSTFRAEAPEEARQREAEGKEMGFASSDLETSKRAEASQSASGRDTIVTARQSIQYQEYGVGETETHVIYGKGATVEDADRNLQINLDKFIQENKLRYKALDIQMVGKREYRVYVRGGY